jgi:nicotinamide-nucleotide amidase
MIATLSIGDELMLGEIVDTNAPFIATHLHGEGYRVSRHLAVGDNEQAIAAAIRDLAASHRVIVATGGLGPTEDDVTARAAAQAFGHEMVLREEVLTHIRAFAARVGRTLHPRNEQQAWLPATAELVPNPVGTAYGFRLEHGGCSLFVLPGVPEEMAAMFTATVLPTLRRLLPSPPVLSTRVLKVIGLPEAEVSARVFDLAGPGIELAYCVVFPEVQLKLRATGSDRAMVEALLDDTVARVRERLGHALFAEGEETMDTVVARLFREREMTLALAESCTGGLIAKRITDLPGSSAYFVQGIVAYANDAKERLLGVPAELLLNVGAVSREVAEAMAQGVRERAGCDLGLAVTGVAGPDGGSAEKPVGTVYIALADAQGCRVERFRFGGNRDKVRIRTAVTALDWLRHRLLAR